MADGEPVTQKQFYTTIEESNGKVLRAIGKVDEKVQDLRVDVKEIATKQSAHETRMDDQDKKIDDQKKWNRGLAAIEAALAALLVAVGIRGD